MAITFVGYAVSVSLAMIYADKHGYSIHPNQVRSESGESRVGLPRRPGKHPCRWMSGAVGSRDLQHGVLFLHLLPQLGYISHHKHTGERWRTHAGTNPHK